MARIGSNSAEALDMLKQDHEKVEKAFQAFEKLGPADGRARSEIAKTVCADLRIHTTLEEEIFYPAVREAIGDEDIMNQAAVEHETAMMLIEQLENMDDDDPNYHATFKVLSEYVRHHVREEEGGIFPAARKTSLDFAALGARMRERRRELSSEIEGAHARGRAASGRGAGELFR